MTEDRDTILMHLRKAKSLVHANGDSMLLYLIAMAIEEAEISADAEYMHEAMASQTTEPASKH